MAGKAWAPLPGWGLALICKSGVTSSSWVWLQSCAHASAGGLLPNRAAEAANALVREGREMPASKAGVMQTEAAAIVL